MSKYRIAEERLQTILQGSPDLFSAGSLIGVEKESLRVTGNGDIAQTPHPQALGSALTHLYITTDFSEALLEFITPPYADLHDALGCMNDIHRFVYANLGDDELLWASSMPCKVVGDESVPIAEYGSSNVGTMKNVYRRGLSHRYGRLMQAISGVHFNYSFPEALWPMYQKLLGNTEPTQQFKSAGYFALIRNFQRQGWLVPYLFGSSPVVCKSFLGEDPTGFRDFDGGSWYMPHATTLRMSDIGYKNKSQAGLCISYDEVDAYIESLTRAIETPSAEYEAIGVVVDGEYRQLNANILQIENEYYSFIRPKRVAHSGEKPTVALARRGVEYVEVRALDVSAFDPGGINEDQMRFLEAFLIFCLLRDSDPISDQDRLDIEHNQQAVAARGREPGLVLRRRGRDVALQDWAEERRRSARCWTTSAACWTAARRTGPTAGRSRYSARESRIPNACPPRACWRRWRPRTSRTSSTPCVSHGNTRTSSPARSSTIQGAGSSRTRRSARSPSSGTSRLPIR
jgi:glutamate--cysteine ligase